MSARLVLATVTLTAAAGCMVAGTVLEVLARRIERRVR